MSKKEIAALLAIAAAFDNRKANEDAVLAWLSALEHLTFNDCREAIVNHYQESREWIMPVDIIDRVRAIRRQRLEVISSLTPPAHIGAIEDPDELDRAYRGWLRATEDRLARGLEIEAEPRQLAESPPKELKAYIDGLNKKLDDEAS